MAEYTIRQREKKFEIKFIDRLRELPYTWWPEKTDSLSRGLPDRIGCIRGQFVALEFKVDEREGAKKTGRIVLQRYRIEKIKKAFGIAFIIFPSNSEEIYNILKDLKK
jgi:hypothetical protein